MYTKYIMQDGDITVEADKAKVWESIDDEDIVLEVEHRQIHEKIIDSLHPDEFSAIAWDKIDFLRQLQDRELLEEVKDRNLSLDVDEFYHKLVAFFMDKQGMPYRDANNTAVEIINDPNLNRGKI